MVSVSIYVTALLLVTNLNEMLILTVELYPSQVLSLRSQPRYLSSHILYGDL